MDNVILNKSAIIENCLLRVKEEYVGFENKAQHNQNLTTRLQNLASTFLTLASNLTLILALTLVI